MIDLNKKPFNLNEKEINNVYSQLNSLNEEQKIGQLFCILGDLYAEKELNNLVKEKAIGGILFRPNASKTLKEKLDNLDKISKIPLLKCANLEDGAFGAIKEGRRIASQLEIAATDNLENSYYMGLDESYKAKEVGINVSFSPDSDIDINCFNPITNERTFGSNPKIVKANVLNVMKGIQENGLASFAKHFPGDGVDFRDQHLVPTYNSLSKNLWYKTYGKIYSSLIKNGILGIMCGHIHQDNLSMDDNHSLKKEDCMPASLSKELLEGVLRKELGFNGVIATDATIMGGFNNAMKRERAIPYCIKCGVDLIVFNTSLEEDLEYMKNGLKNGILTHVRLDEAVTRILALKEVLKRNIKAKLSPYNPSELERKLANESITLVKNKDKVIPLKRENYNEIEIRSLGNDEYPNGSIKEDIRKLLVKEGFKVSYFDIDKVDMHGPKNINKRKLILYLANLETASNQTAVRINWAKKHALDMPRFINEVDYVFISFANPYHFMDVPRIKSCINAYCANESVINMVIEKIMGRSPFKGVSPVDAFCNLEDTKS